MYDVIVIGAGPAGSVTARTVALAGYNVLIIEKNETCMSPCAGYISKTINFEVPHESVLQSNIKRMRTYFPDESYHDFSLNGYVVDRPSFDMSLLSKARELGAQIMWNSPLIEISPEKVKFHNGSAPGRIIVGADGVFSKTASILRLQQQRFAACAQYNVNGIELISQTCEIFFDSDYAPGGYIWIYPTGEKSAKVGLGMIKGKKSPRENLDSFIAGSKIADRIFGKRTGYIAGALPIGGLREKLVFGNVLLAGDSAGMADPITGAGINNAILAGELAGKTIIKALENDDITLLWEYETKIRKLLGRPLDRALEKRIKMDACYYNNLLQEHLPELWVTFKQYWV
ncbi:MAG: NAD(P)/FAD-dependent oxidoreductase [Candidatus Methanoperedens sp.]|nr:NAD(P)/FAD-dependent oxidoreductase [Candidatus Methanoperedens sp.]CAG1004282.1 digeranylgeranylglycerophospholipid reductase [Methanosarcinales archaeon]